MGGIIKAVTNVVKSVFGGGGGDGGHATVTSAPVQQVSARDLVASTSSSEPNAATMGSDSKKQKKNKRGKYSLMVAKDKPTGSSSNTGLNI